jgi:hypothetical protein
MKGRGNRIAGQSFIPGVNTRGDGHFPFNDPKALEGLFNQQQFPSVFKEFVHPGKDPRELLMRCIFKDERERNAAVLYYAKCEEFGLTEEKQILTNWLASTVSVRGLARRELLMAGTGIVAPTLYGVREWGKRKEKEKAEQSEQ